MSAASRGAPPEPCPAARAPRGPLKRLSFGRLAGAAVVALGLLTLAAPAQAQTSITLVSNTSKSQSSVGSIVTFDHAQAFTTGTNSGAGYKLTGVDFHFNVVFPASTSEPTYSLSIWSSTAAGQPDSMQGTALMNPAQVAAGINTFTATGAGIDLTDNTPYFVVLDVSTGGTRGVQVSNTNSNDEDAGAAPGWSIADGSIYRGRESTTGTWTSFAQSRRIAVKGYAKSNAATMSDATLSNLALSDVTLVPAFASATTAYTARVANSVSQTTVTAQTTNSNATVAYLDASDAVLSDADDTATGFQVALGVDDTVIKVRVTAEDGTTTQTYQVTVARTYEYSMSYGAGTWTLDLDDTLLSGVTGVTFSVSSCDADRADYFTAAPSISGSVLTLTLNRIGHSHSAGESTDCTITATRTGGVETRYFAFSIIPSRAPPSPASLTPVGSPATGFRVDPGHASGAYVRLGVRATGASGGPIFYYARGVTSTTVLTVPGLAAGAYDVRAYLMNRAAFELRAAGATLADGELTAEGRVPLVWAQRMDNQGLSRVSRSLRGVQVGTTRTLAVSDATAASEGDSLTFTVTLSAAPGTGQEVRVSHSTYNLGYGDPEFNGAPPATAADDFISASSTLVFSAGQTTKTVTVATVEDTVSEGDESVQVRLSSPVSAVITDRFGYGTIIDDDRAAGVTVAPLELDLVEGGRVAGGVDGGVQEVTDTATYTVVLDSAPTGAVTVTVSGASAGDFTVAPATLTFTTTNWHEARTVTVTAVDDEVIEPAEESFTLTHAVTGYGTVTTADSVTVLIVDDDTGPLPEVSIEAVYPKAAPVLANPEFRVTISAAQSTDVTVNLEFTQDAAWISTSVERTIVILAGDTTATKTFTTNFTPTDGDLTATVVAGTGYAPAAPPDNAATVAMVATPLSVEWTPEDYTVTEGESVDLTVTLRMPDGAPAPRRNFRRSVISGSRTALLIQDYLYIAVNIQVVPGDWVDDGTSYVATKRVTLETVEDEVHEPTERMVVGLNLTAGQPLSTTICTMDHAEDSVGDCDAFVTITDDDPLALTGVAVTSTPRQTSPGGSTPDTYGLGETIEFTATFNGQVAVTGAPRFLFRLGGDDKLEFYHSGTGTTELVFNYLVVASNVDADGISWEANQLLISPDDSITFDTAETADQVNALRNHPAQTALAGHRVNGALTPACAAPSLGDRREVWSVTDAPIAVGVSAYGYRASAPLSVFTIGATDYTLYSIYVFGGDLSFQVTSTALPTTAQRDVLQLHVCDTAYTFSDATVGGNAFTWAQDPDLDWSAVSLRTFALSLPANNAATGAPTISGTAMAGHELSADKTPIMDVDGKPTAEARFSYQWIRLDADGVSNPVDIPGATATTYTLTNADAGKKVKVRVSFTDDLGVGDEKEMVTSAAWPSTGTVASQPAITIAVDQAVATGKIDTLRYTLSREGDTAAALTVPVTLEPFAGNDWSLDTTRTSFDVTFTAGSETATPASPRHVIALVATGFTSIGFSSSATLSGDLTATLGTVSGYDTGDTAVTRVVIIPSPTWVVKLTETDYTFAEDGGAQPIVLSGRAASAEMPRPTLASNGRSVLFVALVSEAKGAMSPADYATLSTSRYIPASACGRDADMRWVCELSVDFVPVDDALVEPDEDLTLGLVRSPGSQISIHVQGPGGSVSSSDKDYPAIIRDDDFGVLSASVSSTPQYLTDTYGAHEYITVAVKFNRAVTVTGSPTFDFIVGTATKTAAYAGGSGTDTLTFTYQVGTGDADSDGIAWAANAFMLDGATLVDAGGKEAVETHGAQSALPDHKVAGGSSAVTAVTVTVAVTSTPLLTSSGASMPDTYGEGETIVFTATFSGAVTVMGDPELAFSLNNPGAASGPRRAAYDAARSSATALAFTYTVLSTDEDTDGIWVGGNPLKLDVDDRIVTAANALVGADLTHSELGTQSGHKVDGSRSAVTVTLTLSKAAVVEGTDATVTLTASTGSTTFSSARSIALTVPGDPSAAEGGDWTVPSKALPLPAGQSSATAVVTIVDDAALEAEETVSFVASVQGASSPPAVLTIADDDTAHIAFAAPTQAVDEGEDIVLTLTMASATQPGATGCIVPLPVFVDVTASGDTAALAQPGTVTQNLRFPYCEESTEVTFATRAPDASYAPPRTLVFAIGNIDDTRVTVGAVARTTVTVTDTLPEPHVPLASATVDGQVLTLVFAEELDASSEPAPGDFAATADGAAVAVNDVTMDGARVVLTLASAVEHGDAVTLTYTPGANPLQNADEKPVADIVERTVANATPDTAKPVAGAAATVDGTVVTLTYDEPLDEGSVPAPGDFTVTVDGTPAPVTEVEVNGATVTVTLVSAAESGQPVTFGYTPGAQPLRDLAGNAADPIAGGPAVNITADETPPVLQSATVDGTLVTLTYDEVLDAGSVPPAGAFLVLAGSSPRVSIAAVEQVEVDGPSVVLTLAEGSAVAPGQAVRLHYAVDRAKPIRDPAGNRAAALSDVAVAHAPAGAPRVVAVKVTSTPGLSAAGSAAPDTYGPGETIAFSVRFSAAVTVRGVPEFAFALANPGAASGPRRAAYAGARSSATALVFTYTVLSADQDTDGIAWAPDALAPGTAGIAGRAAGTAAVATHAARGPLAGHKVDGSRSDTAAPALVCAAPANAPGPAPGPVCATVDGAVLTLTYDEALDAGSVPAPGDFTVRMPTVSQTGETLTLLPDVRAVTVGGRAAVLTLRPPGRAVDTAVTLEYRPGATPLRDAAGNAAPGFVRLAVVNITLDTEAPRLDPPLTVTGDRLTLTWSEPLDAGSVPAPGDFTVVRSVSGTQVPVTVDAVRMDGRAVVLELAAAVRHVSQVKAGYTPGATPVQDLTGNTAPGFAPRRVDNLTPDPAAPAGRGTAVSAEVDGTVLTLTFEESLDGRSVPARGDFTVRIPWVSATGETLTLLPDVGGVRVRNVARRGTVVLTLWQAVRFGETVTLAYTPGANPLRVRGGDVPGFAGRAVDNLTLDTEAPALDPPLTVTGDLLTLTWNEPLDEELVPAPGDFTVSGKAVTVRVLAVTVDGGTVVLRLAQAAEPVWLLKAGYRPGAQPLRDLAGNAAPGFAPRRVTNRTPDTVVPALVPPPTVTDDRLTLAWNEPLDSTSVPAPGDFTVERSVDGTSVTVLIVRVLGSKVVLTLEEPPGPWLFLKAGYTPGANPVRDAVGNVAPGFAPRGVKYVAADTRAQEQIAAPSVTGLPAVTAPVADDGYAAGERIEARVAFDAPVTVDTAAGSPALGLNLGGVRRDAAYESGAGTAALTFALEVAAGDAGAPAARAIANGLVLNGATVRSADGTDAALAFGEAPGIVSVEVAPEAGEAVEVTLVFAEPVAVDTAEGRPSLRALVGSTERELAYARGSGTDRLVFAWTAAKGDGPAASVLVPGDSLVLNGGAIRSTAGLDALLAHNGAGAGRPGVVRRSLPELGVADAAAAEGGTLVFRVTLTPAAAGPVTVDWATADGPSPNGATAGADYTAASGTLTFAPGEPEQTVAVAVLDDDAAEAAETLTLMLSNAVGAQIAVAAASGTIAPSADPDGRAAFTASFSGVPDEHDGAGAFTLTLAFGAEPAGLSYRTVRDSLFTVSGGTLRKARRLSPPSNRRYELTIEPAGDAAVTLALAALPACGAAGAVCTADGRALSGALSATVPGPAALSVADASVREAPGAVLEFRVTLDRTRHAAVTVDYATADGVAKAGADYAAASGMLVFAAGETAKTVAVAVLDDSEDEGAETLTLTLSNPVGARIADGEATGTIVNSDPMPRAWLGRFGRTAWEHALGAVDERLRSARVPGPRATIAGRSIGVARSAADAAQAPRLAALAAWMESRDGEPEQPEVSVRELLAGSEFQVGIEPDAGGGVLTVWGHGAYGRFAGQDDDLAVSGDVASGTLGVDYAGGPWLAGLALSHSSGWGSYEQPHTAGGEVTSSLTGAYPYVSFAVVPRRLALWLAGGYGLGGLRLAPHGGTPLETRIGLLAGAAGVRATVVPAAASGGFSLAVNADGMLLRAASEATAGLAAAAAEVNRLRLGLEGSYALALGGGGRLTPSVEAALRRDGGDAESGLGMDAGGGLSYEHAALGLSLGLRGRALVVHETAELAEWGASGWLAWDPNPASELGPALTVSPSLGAPAHGGAAALWSRQTPAGLDTAAVLVAAGGRIDARFGYGLALMEGVGTPWVGIGLSEHDREYRLGYEFHAAWPPHTDLRVALEAMRRQRAAAGAPEHGVTLRMTLRR